LVQILPNRKQKIEVKSSNSIQSTYSNWGSIKCGVPQGSVLGLFAFHNINYHTSVIILVKNLDDFCMLQILTFPCECMYSLINFITNNKEHFQMNAEVRSANTRHKHCLYKPIVNLSCPQKSAYYAGINIFNNLPSYLKCCTNEKA
jgi:hypothetical protein